MSNQTPLNFRNATRSGNSSSGNSSHFSHERILEVCHAYKRLREHTRKVQSRIDDAIDTFQGSSGSREALTQMLTTLATIDGNIGAALQDDALTIELELVNWQTRSSKLRSEAKRQARRRAERAGGGAPSGASPRAYLTELSESCESDGGEAFVGEAPTNEAPTVISPTMALALRGMQKLHEVDSANATAFATLEASKKFTHDHASTASELKKSGLV